MPEANPQHEIPAQHQQAPIPSAPPTIHHMSPDPWTENPDPWMQWYNDSADQTAMLRQAVQQAPPRQWHVPGIGNVGPSQTFSEAVGLSQEPAPRAVPTTRSSTEPIAPECFSSMMQARAQARPPSALGWLHESVGSRKLRGQGPTACVPRSHVNVLHMHV